jgi:hypothetical protein
MVDEHSSTINQNPTPQFTIILRSSAEFNASQKLINALLNDNNYIL